MVTRADALVEDLQLFDDPDSGEFAGVFSFPRFEQYIPRCASTASNADFDEELREITVLLEEQAALPAATQRTAPTRISSVRVAVERSNSLTEPEAVWTAETETLAAVREPRPVRRALTRLFIFGGLIAALTAVPNEEALHVLWRVQELVSRLVALVG